MKKLNLDLNIIEKTIIQFEHVEINECKEKRKF